jgi:hypothetical protein
MIVAVVVASACTGTQPSAPSVSPVQSSPLVMRHFRGLVLSEDGQPVPGATVSLQPSLTPRNVESATTDSNGVYQMVLDQPPSYGTWGTVTHPLYEDTLKVVPWVPSQTDVTQNFPLYRTMTLAAGDSSHLAITPDNSLCVADEAEFLCRKVHVTVPSSGTLVLDTIADDPANTFWLSVGVVPESGPSVTHVSTAIATATTVVVFVLRPRDVAIGGGFTLKTALAP